MKIVAISIIIIFLISVMAIIGCDTGDRTKTITNTTAQTSTTSLTVTITNINTQTATTATVGGQDIVVFTDDNLEVTIKTALNKQPEEEIRAYELANLIVLSASNRGITDLSGIEYCINLVELDLSDNQINDITLLSTLTKLEVLDLSMNRIVNISAISGLTNLNWLNIQYNDIGDIWPLAYNTGLGEGDRVFLAGNGILIVEHTGPWDVVSELEDRGVKVHTSYYW